MQWRRVPLDRLAPGNLYRHRSEQSPVPTHRRRHPRRGFRIRREPHVCFHVRGQSALYGVHSQQRTRAYPVRFGAALAKWPAGPRAVTGIIFVVPRSMQLSLRHSLVPDCLSQRWLHSQHRITEAPTCPFPTCPAGPSQRRITPNSSDLLRTRMRRHACVQQPRFDSGSHAEPPISALRAKAAGCWASGDRHLRKGDAAAATLI